MIAFLEDDGILDIPEIDENKEDASVSEKCAFVSQELPDRALQAVGLSLEEAARLASPAFEDDMRLR